jgi:hypothetical protein
MKHIILLFFCLPFVACGQNLVTKKEAKTFFRKAFAANYRLKFCGTDSAFFNNDTIQLKLAAKEKTRDNCSSEISFSRYKKRRQEINYQTRKQGPITADLYSAYKLMKRRGRLHAIHWKVLENRDTVTFQLFQGIAPFETPRKWKVIVVTARAVTLVKE